MNLDIQATQVSQKMKSLKRLVPSYFDFLSSPSNPRNRLQGKRIVNLEALRISRAYAGKRTRTPGVIPVSEPWGFRSPAVLDDPNSAASGPRAVFSSCYRPQIRVNINTNLVRHVRNESRLRKPVPDNRSHVASLKASLVMPEAFYAESPKHPSFSLKTRSAEAVDRRIRRDHPVISQRMRRGSDIQNIMKSQLSNDQAQQSGRSTACSCV